MTGILDTVTNQVLLPLYYIGGIVVGGSVFLVLRQLRLARQHLEFVYQDSQLKSKREAAQMAATQCEVFAQTIIPLSGETKETLIFYGGTPYGGNITGFERDDLRSVPKSWFETYFKAADNAKNNGQYLDTMKLLNQLEALAIYFTEGIASEEIAFPSIGKLFCAYIQENYPMLMASRLSGDKFSYTIKLYKTWNSRIQSQDLLRQKQQIDDKLQSLDTSPIEIIGVSR